MMYRLFRKNLCFVLIAINVTLINACATSNQPDSVQAQQRKQALHSWISCLQGESDTSLSLSTDIRAQHRARMLACQGHEFDLLATYPRHMKPSLDRVIEQSAQQVLLGQAKETDAEKNLQKLDRQSPRNNRWQGIMNSGSQPRMNSLSRPPG